MEPNGGAALQDAHAFVAALDEVDLSRFRVVGSYARYDEAVRNALQDARQKILAGFEPPGHKRENHLIWAAPGTGKTYFVQQVAASLPNGVGYHEINLAKGTETEFRAALRRLDGGDPYLCLIDEVDAKPQEPWPYEVLLPYLDAAVERGARFVFVLAGSSGSSLDEIKQRIAARPKGTDLLSRIPPGHEHVIAPMSLGDRVLIVLSQLRQAGMEGGRDIRAIERLGLYYVALNERLANARQLREFAVRAVERVPKTDHRVKYDHLFVAGDPENKAFWAQASPVAERLVGSFVILAGDVVSTHTSVSMLRPSYDGAAVAIEAPPRSNLPRQLTSFIGREREIDEVKQLLPTTALLTLHGPGGCGKTRLALRVAADFVDQYPDGVWVAELAVLSDPGLVPKAVATALDVTEQPGRAVTETLKDALRRRSLLLVLDNCEHLVSACSEMTEVLLRACPTLRILATSREPLGISGEIVWDVPSLSVPEQSRVPSPEQLGRFDGVRLFVERAAASRPGFALTVGNAASVVQVCSQLEGIPLALELAASRVKVLTVEQIADRLDDRFRLLTGGRRTALPRHQTLQATMDWSYGFLSEQERTMLRRLSVFAGGWTVEAAEAVCAGAGIDAGHILDLLASLIDKSLVMAETQSGEVRYRLLETIRRYGWERLVESDEAAEVQTRHRAWYLDLAERAEAQIHGPEDLTWFNRLEVEHDNLRAALGGSNLQDGDAEARLPLVVALYEFWNARTHWGEGRKWLDAAVTETRNIKSPLRVKVLWKAGHLAWRQGDWARAAALSEESVAIARELHDQRGLAQALYIRAIVAHRQGHFDAAIPLFNESLDLSRALQMNWQIAMIHGAMGGGYERLKGDYAKAVALCETGLAMFRTLGSRRGVAVGLYLTGHAVRSNGDFERAVELFRENLLLFGDVGDKWIATECIEGLALIATAQGFGERAARLFGAAEAARETYGVTMLRREAVLAATKERPQESHFANAWAEGRAMTLEQAVEYALAEKPTERPEQPSDG